MEKTENAKCWWEVGVTGTFTLYRRECTLVLSFWKNIWQYLLRLQKHPRWHSNSTLWHTLNRNVYIHSSKDSYEVFYRGIFPKSLQLKTTQMSINTRTNEYILVGSPMGYKTAVKMNFKQVQWHESLKHKIEWKKSNTEEFDYCLISFAWKNKPMRLEVGRDVPLAGRWWLERR